VIIILLKYPEKFVSVVSTTLGRLSGEIVLIDTWDLSPIIEKEPQKLIRLI